MYQDFEDNVDVIALFEKNTLRPCRFRWRGKVYKVSRITGDWQSKVGQSRLWHFAVIDGSSNCFQLCYDEQHCSWKLAKVWVE